MARVIDEIEGPVIVGGHSYGGLVITEAAAGRGDKVHHLLYISGIVGDKCVMDSDYVVPGEAPETDLDIRLLGFPVPVPKSMSVRTGAQGAGPSFWYALGRRALQMPGVQGTLGEGQGAGAFKSNEIRRLSDTSLIDEGLKRVTRQSLASFLQAPKGLAWKEIPSTYVLGLDDREVPRPQLRMQASHCTNVVEVPTNHFCHLDRPDLVAEIVVKIADAIDSGVPVVESMTG
jgi:pimeloyl-ACP methyl ester carboxylesterase